ncbi:FAD:protein FMN transferase [soil metagenome]
MNALRMVIAAALIVGNAKAAERYEFEEPHVGTKVRIVLYAADQVTARTASDIAFARIAALEQVLSDYRETSEIMKLCKANDAEPGKSFAISDDLARIMTVAHEVSKKSEGTFDVTIGPLSQLWRQTRKSKTLPDAKVLDEAKAKVGWQHVKLDAKAKTLTLAKPGMRLDFGGIGKGFAADEALAELKKQGITSALVAMSGDIAVSDAPPGRDGWTVDIAALNPGDPSRKLKLVNSAVSTSGDLFQNVEIGGVRYSHVLDPKTGLGLTGYRSVTVIAKQGVYADCLCKAASMLPVEKAMKVIAEYDRAAAFMAIKETSEIKAKTTESELFKTYTVTVKKTS